MDIIDVPALYHKSQQDWLRWTHPIRHEGFWFSKDYHEEIMNMFENTSTGMKIVFVFPMPPKTIKKDHE